MLLEGLESLSHQLKVLEIGVRSLVCVRWGCLFQTHHAILELLVINVCCLVAQLCPTLWLRRTAAHKSFYNITISGACQLINWFMIHPLHLILCCSLISCLQSYASRLSNESTHISSEQLSFIINSFIYRPPCVAPCLSTLSVHPAHIHWWWCI